MFSTTREEIAEAVTGTFGGMKIVGYAYRPADFKAGASWPLIDTIERGPGDAFLVSWNVIVVLSADERTAMEQFEDVLPALIAAIEDTDTGYVASAAPVTVTTSAGDLFALSINVRSE